MLKDHQNRQNLEKGMNLLTAYTRLSELQILESQTDDKSSKEYQRITWEMLKRSIQNHLSNLTWHNVLETANGLFLKNLVRGRGFFARTLLQCQATNPAQTPVYAALVAVVNSKFPNIGKLVLTRLMVKYLSGLRRKDKKLCVSSSLFIAHLVNQRVVSTLLALDVIDRVINPEDDDSLEILVTFMKECGIKLNQQSRAVVDRVFDALIHVLAEGTLNKRMQFMVEDAAEMYRNEFQGQEDAPRLDIVNVNEQYTHSMLFSHLENGLAVMEDHLDVFNLDPDYLANEKIYADKLKEILLPRSQKKEVEENLPPRSQEEEEVEENLEPDAVECCIDDYYKVIKNKINWFMDSTLTPEDCVRELLKIENPKEQELVWAIVQYCSEMEEYDRFLGQVACELGKVNKFHVTYLENIFKSAFFHVDSFSQEFVTNVSRFFGHLLCLGTVSWEILKHVGIQEDMSRSAHFFIKALFTELVDHFGYVQLNSRLYSPMLKGFLFKNEGCAIRFFTSVGLLRLVEDLRE